jgi:hypothetical protein
MIDILSFVGMLFSLLTLVFLGIRYLTKIKSYMASNLELNCIKYQGDLYIRFRIGKANFGFSSGKDIAKAAMVLGASSISSFPHKTKK